MKVLVTGGGGFLGRALVRRLIERGDEVVVLGRRRYEALEAIGAKCVVCDLRDRIGVRRACEGKDLVFHVGAVAGLWGDYNHYYEINVDGTRHVVEGCLETGVPRLVYTSTASVVFSGKPLVKASADTCYPRTFLNAYTETKMKAELLVAQAVDQGLVATILRPHLIWGIGDPHFVPRLVTAARRGRLIRVGSGRNLVDITYVEDAVSAHLAAAENLEVDSVLRGKAYFITQGTPVRLWEFVDRFLRLAGLPTVKRALPLWLARMLGAFMEWLYSGFHLKGEPWMTRFLATQLGVDHYFDISEAVRDFGYEPTLSPDEILQELVGSDWFKSMLKKP